MGAVYGYTGEGVGGRNAQILAYLAGVLEGLGKPWLLAGDWNIPVADLEASGWLQMVRGVTIKTGQITCTSGAGEELDYGVAAAGMEEALEKVEVWTGAASRPHSPVIITFKGSTEVTATIRHRCKAFPWEVPFGPSRELPD